ncbi:hypothetical protein AciX9_0591 [Granulicella tundricola MP5ACTX9]|uniref:Sugar O-methyltransferase n=1 Tax=Granulicella tundricola (strain ATCC BAA-1859 / DSM 23138 / MP5ACTX9) TaxID=1198114 RepID=E8WZ60_GRATM|nr:hypothetical protein AciX9_0591 [Granulicella tundricola MP5ACTX9]
MLKPRHLFHPVRTLRTARSLVSSNLLVRRSARAGKRRFAHDERYILQSVTDGFLPHTSEGTEDEALLQRICTAYKKAVAQEGCASDIYQATGWWQQVRTRSLGPVMKALLASDTKALHALYRNFFRDSCSAGLISIPPGMAKAYFQGGMRDLHRHYYLQDVLQSIDYWRLQTEGRFAIKELAGPAIGNPFGAFIEGTLVESGAEYRHGCAQSIKDRLIDPASAVAEIGGGFGGMAYYLLRNQHGMRYINFDVPESLALAAYYLGTAFPALKLLLFGEVEVTQRNIEQADVILMPLSQLEVLPQNSVALTFSAHAMSDLGNGAMAVYLQQVERISQDAFLYIGHEKGHQRLSATMAARAVPLQLVKSSGSDWNRHRSPETREVETLYKPSH